MEVNNSTGQNMTRFYAAKLLPNNYKEEAKSLLNKLQMYENK